MQLVASSSRSLCHCSRLSQPSILFYSSLHSSTCSGGTLPRSSQPTYALLARPRAHPCSVQDLQMRSNNPKDSCTSGRPKISQRRYHHLYKPDVYGSEQSVLYFPPTTTVPELTLPVFCDVLTSWSPCRRIARLIGSKGSARVGHCITCMFGGNKAILDANGEWEYPRIPENPLT